MMELIIKEEKDPENLAVAAASESVAPLENKNNTIVFIAFCSNTNIFNLTQAKYIYLHN